MISVFKMLSDELMAIAPDQNILESLNIGYVNENYEAYLHDFKLAVKLLGEKINENDKVAIQCALTRVKLASLNMSNIFQDIMDDVILINKHDSWPPIPENYKFSE